MRIATLTRYGLIGIIALVLLTQFALDNRRASSQLPGRDAGQETTDIHSRTVPLRSTLVSAADERLLELASMSSSFRNETFLVAIRSAGYRCVHFLGAIPHDRSDSGIWLIQCDNGHDYLVGVEQSGELGVEPAPRADTPVFLQREIETPLSEGPSPP